MDTPEEAVIPAGGRLDGEYARAAGTVHRALAPAGPEGKPALQCVVDALRAAGVRRIVAVAEDAVKESVGGVDQWVQAGRDGARNILAGLAAVRGDRPALVCTSDIPLATGPDIAAFVARCGGQAGIAMGLVSRPRLEEAYPDAPASTFVALSDAGPVAPACVFTVRPAVLLGRADLVERVFAARKSQLRSASLLGPALALQFVRRRLTLRAIATRAEGLLGCEVEVLHDVAPSLCYDIDSLNDYVYVKTCSERAR